MVKCTICSNQASYTNTDLGGNHTHYCVECLPTWLHQRAQAGEFPLVSPVEEKKEEKPSKKKAAKVEAPVEEPVAVETPAEEASADENN